jgi:predicted DNA-binding protein (MmcQ/YjbR family)
MTLTTFRKRLTFSNRGLSRTGELVTWTPAAQKTSPDRAPFIRSCSNRLTDAFSRFFSGIHYLNGSFRISRSAVKTNMDIDDLRRLCLAFPAATEHVQWGNNLVFKVRGKMFAVTALEPADLWLSFKVTPEQFAEYTEKPGIIPAPYLARASWVGIESPTIIPSPELASLLRGSYDLVVAKLPRKMRETLAASQSAAPPRAKPKRKGKKPPKSARTPKRK